MIHSVDISIAQDSPADIGALTALRIAWHPGSPDANAEFAAQFADWFATASESRVFWIARREGEPIGMVNLVLFERMPVPGGPSGGWGYLSNMFVIEPERNSGIGRQMVHTLLRHADESGLERIVVNPSERSIPFYTRHGFDADNELLVRQRPSVRRKRQRGENGA